MLFFQYCVCAWFGVCWITSVQFLIALFSIWSTTFFLFIFHSIFYWIFIIFYFFITRQSFSPKWAFEFCISQTIEINNQKFWTVFYSLFMNWIIWLLTTLCLRTFIVSVVINLSLSNNMHVFKLIISLLSWFFLQSQLNFCKIDRISLFFYFKFSSTLYSLNFSDAFDFSLVNYVVLACCTFTLLFNWFFIFVDFFFSRFLYFNYIFLFTFPLLPWALTNL